MKVGIVGMPNAGKSSLFNALTRAGAEAANYPFTTIEPNVAVVPVVDERLDRVAETIGSSNVVYDTIDFHDIAGLVRGASEGEGLGNKFLANIREVDAIVHVVRAHHDDNVIHPEGEVDPRRDIDTIETELLYADLEQAERRLERVTKQARGGDKQAQAEERWVTEVIAALQEGRPARTVPVPADAPDALRNLHPLTAKPVLLVANVDEGDDTVPPAVAEHAAQIGALAVAVSSRLEAELSELDDEDASAMRADMGVGESQACAASSTAPSRCCTRSPSSPPARTSRRSRGTCATASRPGTPRARSTPTSRRASCAPRSSAGTRSSTPAATRARESVASCAWRVGTTSCATATSSR